MEEEEYNKIYERLEKKIEDMRLLILKVHSEMEES